MPPARADRAGIRDRLLVAVAQAAHRLRGVEVRASGRVQAAIASPRPISAARSNSGRDVEATRRNRRADHNASRAAAAARARRPVDVPAAVHRMWVRSARSPEKHQQCLPNASRRRRCGGDRGVVVDAGERRVAVSRGSRSDRPGPVQGGAARRSCRLSMAGGARRRRDAAASAAPAAPSPADPGMRPAIARTW